MASRHQWHDREVPLSAEGRPHVPNRWKLGRNSSIGPVGDSQCMEGIQSLISRTGVRFSPAVTGGILRPFPLWMHQRHRLRVLAEGPHWKALPHTSFLAYSAIHVHFQGPGHPLTCLFMARGLPSPICWSIPGRPQGRQDLHHRGPGHCEDSLHSLPQTGVHPPCGHRITFTTGHSLWPHDSLWTTGTLPGLPGDTAVSAGKGCMVDTAGHPTHVARIVYCPQSTSLLAIFPLTSPTMRHSVPSRFNWTLPTHSQKNAVHTFYNYSFQMHFNPSFYRYVFKVVSFLQDYNPHFKMYMETRR